MCLLLRLFLASRKESTLGRGARRMIFWRLMGGLYIGLTTSGVWALPLTSENCGDPFVNGVGPYDYLNPLNRSDGLRLPIVEKHHFTPEVESLSRGHTSTDILADIDYTLRASPNHHRALYAMSKLFLMRNGQHDPNYRSAECYFDRAIRFAPRDAMVYMICGIYLAKKGDTTDALTQYQEALKLAPESPEIHYNLGLLYLSLKDYQMANYHAINAYRLGYPLPHLKTELKRAGTWNPDVLPPSVPSGQNGK